jgi:RNA polymerase-binding transcription factor DksA
MRSGNHPPPEPLAREVREVRQRFFTLRRFHQRRGGPADLPERRRVNLLDSAMAEVVEQHSEVMWRRLADRTRALTEAEERLREGGYGICEDCGCRIPRRRLQAIPTATLCVQCQERREAAAASARGSRFTPRDRADCAFLLGTEKGGER